MLAVFLLCAAFALSGATAGPVSEPQEEISAEQHPPLDQFVSKALDGGMEEVEAQEAAADSMSADAAESRKYCDPGWTTYGSRCFKFFSRPRQWLQAEHYCLQYDANLASVHSSEEYRFVRELVMRETGALSRTWIGGTDGIQNNVWLWSDGSRFDYNDWGWGEPNNAQGRESCIEMNYGDEKRWNDWSCDDVFPFVCAKRLSC